MGIPSGLEQTIARVRRDNDAARNGVSQHAGSDIDRLLAAAEEAAALRQQLAEARARPDHEAIRFFLDGGYMDESLLNAEAAVRRYCAVLLAEAADLRRQLEGETDEFNAGFEARQRGLPLEAEPSGLQVDVWRHGWIVADYDSTLRRQLAEAQT